MARSREPQADGYNGIVCTQKTERYYSERERASPLVFSARFRFATLVPIPLFPRNSLPSSERLRSYLHKRYLPTASADRKKNTIHEITHALNEARIFTRGVSINPCENYITIRDWGNSYQVSIKLFEEAISR